MTANSDFLNERTLEEKLVDQWPEYPCPKCVTQDFKERKVRADN